ncbi:MAG TPA: asparagine synthase (glutamine-hydrolyzing), partial [Gemmataceae bacterium]|nr:asparagine synthase (glutamine-hydrolyzing) [Gemmataceae bacterium]
MCGLAGLIDCSARRCEAALREDVRRMARALSHRGPDDDGDWVSAADGVALGFRRLAVLDLSPAGRQPMLSPGGRYVLVFNGEVYNHAELRAELDVPYRPWRGHSDTEVLLAAIEAWGLREALRRSVGMFALAVWDRRDGVLRLARDRLGEKPLYYGLAGGAFLFGSELKALRAFPGFDAGIEAGVLPEYLRLGYIPAPRSIYRGIFKLPPGTILTAPGGAPEPYWSPGPGAPFTGSEEDAADRLDGLLRAAVRGQLAADVPLGALLSGGTDSSLVVAMMQAEARRPVQTFTVGFAERSHDESAHARAVARHLGTEHTEMVVGAGEALAAIPDLPAVYDEPFADPTQVPTLLVARLARRHVAVAVGGDGGDELFAGYGWYRHARRI